MDVLAVYAFYVLATAAGWWVGTQQLRDRLIGTGIVVSAVSLAYYAWVIRDPSLGHALGFVFVALVPGTLYLLALWVTTLVLHLWRRGQ